MYKGTSPQIQNALFAVISIIMNEFISEELDKTEFVAILLDKTLNISNKSQLSMCLRYVEDLRDIEERLFRFMNVSASKTSDVLFQLTDQVVCSLK